MHSRLAIAITLLLATTAAQAFEAPEAARRLAQDAIIVDTHIDAPSSLQGHWDDLGETTPGKEFDYPKARQGGLDVAFMSIYTSPQEDLEAKAWQSAHVQIDSVEALVQRHPDRFALLTSPADLQAGVAAGKVMLALGMENGAPIGDDLSQLAKFHARGVRYITLT
ncbi:MAG TPA: membrane dipeptidase, partial [Lysobacter sp.]